jgi:hypothetical protein
MRTYNGQTAPESVTPTNIAINALAATTRVKFTVIVPGANVGDFVVPRLNADPEAGLAIEAARVSAANTVDVWIYNRTAGALPAAAVTLDAMALPTDEA